jgi:UDP-N-acetylmuramoylalanine--D-glutamate ligase
MYVVIGLGKTGISCVRWLRAQGLAVRAMDTRAEPPEIDTVRAQFPGLEVHLGGLRADWFTGASALVVSPGVAVAEPEIAAAAAQGVPVLGDIELFARAVRAPVLGITGSNGKSTVTALVGEMARAAGRRVAVGGNFGTPALDLLGEDAELYVLELSSFQLETTDTLELAGATILNVSEDHLDRYAGMTEYAMAKQRIHAHAHVAVVNREDRWSAPRGAFAGRTVTFGAGASARGYGIAAVDGKRCITLDGSVLVDCESLRIKGTHNQLNAMAALALGQAAGLPMDAMLAALRDFPGLPHRCRFVAERDGVSWYNDSKGTNIGATAAALAGLAENIRGKVVLIAGGLGKDQDFRLLDAHVRAHVRHVVLIGRDASLIRAALSEQDKLVDAPDMASAVAACARLAQPGDAVLLSPACASFDMYSGYAARGSDFEQRVRALAGEGHHVA